jgi:hypothetical protein
MQETRFHTYTEPQVKLFEIETYKGKFISYLIKYNAMKRRGSGGIAPLFFTSAPD